MRSSWFRRLLLGVVLWLLSAGVAAAYLTDGDAHVPSDYGSFNLPAMGSTFTDPAFGTPILRLSDATATPSSAAAGNLTWVMTEYATMSPFNGDNTRLILLHDSYFGLYDGSGAYLQDLPLEISASTEPRWSRTDPDLLYYVRDNQLKSYDIGSATTSVVRTFAEYSLIGGKGESDISFDGDHFVFHGDNGEVFVYRISTNQKGLVLETGSHAFDSLQITPDNHVIVTWLQNGTNRFNGIELFDINMNFLRQLTPAGGHMDVGRDSNGSEIMVWANAGDPTPICNNGVVKIRLSDAQQTCLLSLDFSLAFNVSAPDDSGWVLVSTYAPSDPDPFLDPWPAYTNEILLVMLDGSETRRLAHHRSRPFGANTYNYTPRVSVGRDGRKLVFSSNFGLQSQLSYPTEYSDAYMVELGSPSTPPPATTLIAPDGTIPDTAPTYEWFAADFATKYQIHLIRSGVGAVYTALHAAEPTCSGGICSIASPPAPTLAEADHLWRIRAFNGAGTGEWSPFKTFTVDPNAPPPVPDPLSPEGTIASTTPTYTWSESEGATKYQIHVIRSGVGSVYTALHGASSVCSAGTCAVDSPPAPTLASGDYIWRLRAFNDVNVSDWSAFSSFTVSAPAPPAPPTLISPSGFITDTTPIYSWNESTGATKYQIHVIRSGVGSIYTAVHASSSICSGSTCSIASPPAPTLAPGDYIWRARAFNDAGTGDWSPFTTFTVGNEAPPAPTLISPSGTIGDTTPDYVWNASAGATKYQLHVIRTGVSAVYSALHTATDICAGGTCTVASPPVPTLSPGGYIWRVRAFNAAGTGEWSAFTSFTVQ